MDFVSTICDHYYAAYGSCFKKHVYRSKKCGDPFDSHKEKIPVWFESYFTWHVRPVSEQQAAGHQAELQVFKKSNKEDTAWIPVKNMIKIVESLKTTTHRGRTYKMNADEMKIIDEMFSSMMENGNE